MADSLFAAAAEAEFNEALIWYARQDRTLAEAFDREVSRVIDSIAARPELFPRSDSRHRQAMMRRFPYRLIFRDDGNKPIIVAVAHHRRRPGYWKDRSG